MVDCSMATALLMVVGACNNARWQDASNDRLDRIESVTSWYAAHDAAGKDRIYTTLGFARDAEVYHRQNLAYTTDLVRQTYEDDVTDWRVNAPLREKALRDEWNAHPETIPDTWARLVY